jgi:hypothetical protein
MLAMKAFLPNSAISQKFVHVAVESRAFHTLVKHFKTGSSFEDRQWIMAVLHIALTSEAFAGQLESLQQDSAFDRLGVRTFFSRVRLTLWVTCDDRMQ